MITWSFSVNNCIEIMIDGARVVELVYNNRFNLHIAWSSEKANDYWDEIFHILKAAKSILKRTKKL